MKRLRDWDYIESRLLAPAVSAGEAHERLRQIGLVEEADELMEAMKTFQDACRSVRDHVRQALMQRNG